MACVSPSLEFVTGGGRQRRSTDMAPSETIVRPITNPTVLAKTFVNEHDDDTDSASKTNSLQIPYGFIMDNVTDLLVYGTMTVSNLSL